MLEYENGKNRKKFKLILTQLIEEHGISAILAVLVVGTACFIAITQTWRGSEVTLPKYFTELSTLILGYYFGKRTRSQTKK